ncbi:MAG: hypothetical protein OSJ43_15755 [Oscillospiraceae bacterium]|nr:hypothetical protein [Oscillospiraceae bacterium]
MLIRNTPYYKMNRQNRSVQKMQLERSPSLFDYISGNVKLIDGKLEAKKSADKMLRNTTDVILISEETLTKMRNEYIEASLNSGEPMTGVSYDDFVRYYVDKQGFRSSDDYMQRLYFQAQKGWKASCAEREWRTNPDFIMTDPMLDSPELTEDREAAFEKFKNGEELTKLEDDLLSTFPDFVEGEKRINEVIKGKAQMLFQQNLHNRLSNSGVELSSDDEITFTVWGYDLIDVKGTVSDEKLAAIKDAMANSAHSLDCIYGSKYIRLSEGTKFQLEQFKRAQHYLDLAGGGSLLELSKDQNGDYHGIPEELDKFLRENKHYRGDDMARLQAIWVEHAFDAAIAAVEAGRYEWFKSMIGTVTFKNGEFYS